MTYLDFEKLVEGLAQEAFENVIEYSNDIEGSIYEHVDMVCDGTEWVIYNGKALDLVTFISESNQGLFQEAENYAYECGRFDKVEGFYQLAVILAFCILSIEVQRLVERKVEAWKCEEVAQ